MGGHHAPEAGAEPAGHARLERELSGYAATGADRPDRLEHRRRPAPIHLDLVGAVLELVLEQLGHEPVMTDAAVVGGDGGVVEQIRSVGVGLVSEPEQGR